MQIGQAEAAGRLPRDDLAATRGGGQDRPRRAHQRRNLLLRVPPPLPFPPPPPFLPCLPACARCPLRTPVSPARQIACSPPSRCARRLTAAVCPLSTGRCTKPSKACALSQCRVVLALVSLHLCLCISALVSTVRTLVASCDRQTVHRGMNHGMKTCLCDSQSTLASPTAQASSSNGRHPHSAAAVLHPAHHDTK